MRKLSRKLGLHRRGSSYPFISGDTYRELCDLVYDGDDHKIHAALNSLGSDSISRLFLPLPLSRRFLNWINSHEMDFLSTDLFMHNGDIIPSVTDMEFLSKRFRNLHCVNWVGNSTKIYPIPIGLENRSLHTNGVPRDFMKLISAGVPPLESRKNEILISFSLSTNFAERSESLELASSFSKVDLRIFQGSIADYHQELLANRYILSPPGNGFDCHRTWEAIYLGCIPIVKRAFWPFCNLNLPVIVLEDWSDISRIGNFDLPNQMSVDELKALFLEKRL